MVFGKRLELVAKTKYKNMVAFAEALKIKPQHLHRIIRGDNFPGEDLLRKIRALGFDINWLLDEGNEIELAVREPSIAYYQQEESYKTKYERLLKKVKVIIEEEGNKR
jgi:transcriptional regulator with XRE-family HTH domain